MNILVDNAEDLVYAIALPQALVIRLTANVTLLGMSDVASNKTILGVGRTITIIGGGFRLQGVSNVIIRNLYFLDWSDDALDVEASTNVLIDHNTFDHGFDGCVDIKRGSDFVTVSWNVFINHHKTSLLGHSDDNGAQDIGHLRVTYHHNWFRETLSRHPRVRFANPVHVFNNYYLNNALYGIVSTMNASVLVEGNYFLNLKRPYDLQEGDSGPGFLVAVNNAFVNCGSGLSGGSVDPIPYPYVLDNPLEVPAIVVNGAGAGFLNIQPE